MTRLQDNTTKVFTDHNVYILGAGFSVDAGIPVLSDFLYQMRLSLNHLKKDHRVQEFQATSDVLQFRKEAASAALRVKLNIENIEDLFSLAAASGQYPLAQSVSTAIAATIGFSRLFGKENNLEVVVKHGIDRPLTWKEKGEDAGAVRCIIPLYELFAGLLSGKVCYQHDYMRNTVITLNYDTVLEEALEQWHIPVWYGFNPGSVKYPRSKHFVPQHLPTALPIFKLHGSVNWASPRNTREKIQVYNRYTDIVRENRNVLLVPPTWRKTFTGPISEVWDAAVKALSEATRIIIVGFSIPPTDIHFKYLLAAGLQENISLRKIFCFNPDKTVEDNLFKILREDLREQRVVDFRPIDVMNVLSGTTTNYQSVPTLFDRSFNDRFRDIRWANENQ
jgi:hypothetical protein